MRFGEFKVHFEPLELSWVPRMQVELNLQNVCDAKLSQVAKSIW